MSTLAYTVSDSATMVRRNLLHMLRYPSVSVMLIGIPVILLLLFVYVFGGVMGAGLGPAAGGRDAYIEYVVPGILMLALTGTAQGTAISVAMDMTEGIIARFKTMAIARSSVLTGHVIGSVIQALLGVGVVFGVALLIGFRPHTSPIQWLAALGIIALTSLALTWLTVAIGLASPTVESASNTPMFLILLPFLGSGFVPTASMPAAVRWFADYQPFTPIMETLRGLLLGTPIGNSAILAVLWCVAITVGGYVWAMSLYNRPRAR